jgi:tetratricopeptide (TPR) repeat protein
MARLESLRALFAPFDPEQKNALFAGYLAQWVDIGFQRPVLVKEVVACFSKSVRSRLPLHDYVYLRRAEGMIAMSEEGTEEAIQRLDFVLGLDEQTDDKELLAIANFWKGRCLRMKGEHDQALETSIRLMVALPVATGAINTRSRTLRSRARGIGSAIPAIAMLPGRQATWHQSSA